MAAVSTSRAAVGSVMALLLAAVVLSAAPQAPASAAALTGQVTSQEEGPMEGVLVSAKRDGSSIRVTVVSDQQGHFAFPQAKLETGKYSLSIRAVGYETNPTTVEVRHGKAAKADLRLWRTKDLAAQLSNAEWLQSMPDGTDKNTVRVLDCAMCHTLQRVVHSEYNADELTRVMLRMSIYYIGSSPLLRQIVPAFGREPGDPERFRKPAEFLSAVNLSKSATWSYPLKTLPRLKGRSTRVIITEYDLPSKVAQPHDAIVGSDGMVWYMDFAQMLVGKLDPKTGHVKEYPVPTLKPEQPRGGLEIQEDKSGNIWVGLQFQAGIAKFDRKTEKFQMFPLPSEMNNDRAQISMMVPTYSNVDGKVWMKVNGTGSAIKRVDVETGKFESAKPLPRGHGAYGISADSKNNCYFMEVAGENIGRVDARTLEVKLYPTPTRNSGPRRGHVDSQDRLWFAEFTGNKVGMFDPRSQQIREWPLPTPWTSPYDAVADKNGEVWTGGMNSDRVDRLNPKSGQVVEYQLPEETNIRRVFVDNSTTPVTFWVGNDHHASIVKLEPLD